MAETQDLNNLSDLNLQKKLFDQRIIILSDPVNSQTARKIIEKLLAMDAAESGKDILLYLNSPGGEVNSGFGIYDTMRFIQSPVKVIVTGLAASIATVILLGAQKQHRFAMPNARLLIHQPLIAGNIEGQASDIEIHAQEIIKTRQRIAQLYVEETGQNLDRVQKDIERDYWMTAQEAVEYGLVTKIIEKADQIA